MLRSPLRSLAVLLFLLLALALVGTSCQEHAKDCNQTLTCATGGSADTGGGTGLGASAGEGGQGGLGGEGGAGAGTGGTGTGGNAPCDPTTEQCDGSVIVHVSPVGSDEDSGDAITPVRTLGAALTRAAAAIADGETSVLVYLCTTEGSFEETLSIDAEHSGVGIYGGFNCDTFEPNDERATIIAADANGHRIEDATTVTLGDVHLESPDAEGAGASSYGLTVVDSTGVLIVRSEIVAGAGAAGAAGEGFDERAEPGASGDEGTDACVVSDGSVNEGGEAAVTICNGDPTESVGGSGGPGGISTFGGGDGEPGEPDGGEEGIGQTDTVECGEGTKGQNGSAGDHGNPSNAIGTLEGGTYLPPAGATGMPGQAGEGGGGGGGATRASCVTGASGGSGGGGGCPGAGGGGGKGGGGSFGLVSASSTLVVDGLAIVVALGGDGGLGLAGQLGGLAGESGPGGGPGTGDGVAACRGGDGGQGGRGGSGGGGAGGPSIGVVFVGDVPVGLDGVEYDIPTVGAAGGVGGENNPEGNASAGVVDETWDANP